MAVRITWVKNEEDDIDSYELDRSTDGIVFALLATITHDISDPLVFDSVNNVFFYDDATGVANTHFYRLRALDTALNASAYTTPKQVGPPSPGLCSVFGTIVDLDGNPNTDIQVVAEIVSEDETKDGQIVDTFGVTSNKIECFTDDNGFFEITLMQGAAVILDIPTIDLRKEIAIPTDKTVVDFRDLI